jgi:hypothetical protein
MAVGTCFGCGARKPAFATLLVRERHERLALCADCLRAAQGGLVRLAIASSRCSWAVSGCEAGQTDSAPGSGEGSPLFASISAVMA